MEAVSYVRVVVVVVFISSQEKKFLICVIKKNFEKYQKGEKFNATSAFIKKIRRFTQESLKLTVW